MDTKAGQGVGLNYETKSVHIKEMIKLPR